MEEKYYLEKRVLKDVGGKGNFPLDYPLFIAFMEEDRKRIQRNFAEVTLNGMSPDFRKICATRRCNEGFTIRELIDTLSTVPEVSKEEFFSFMEIPHWNPIEKLDQTIAKYSKAVQQAREESKNSPEMDILNEITKTYVDAITKEKENEEKDLLDGEYTKG